MSTPNPPEPPGDQPSFYPPPPGSQPPQGGQPGYESRFGTQPQPPSYQAPQGQQGWQGQATPPGASGTNGLAIAALICAIVWVCGLGSIAGVILGVLALNQLKKTGQAGRGLAIAGIAVGAIGAIITVIVFFSLVVIGEGITNKVEDLIEKQEEYQQCVDAGRDDCVAP